MKSTKSPNELSRLNRKDLLEILLALSEENEKLKEQIKEMQGKLDDRTLQINESGSLAEAVVKINGLFEAAEASCEQYIHNVQERCKKTEKACDEYIFKVQMRCDALVEETKQRCIQIIEEAEKEEKAEKTEIKNNGTRII